MKKKVLSLLLVAAMGLSMLVGCGGGNDQPSGGNTEGAGNGEVKEITLTVWAPDNQQELLKKQEADFAAKHPEYKINWVNAAVGEDKAKDEVLKDVDAAADVFFYANDQVQELVKAGAIARLGGDVEKMVNDTIAPAVVDTVKVNGALYGVPFTHNTFFMMYDKELLKDVDITSLDAILAANTPDGVYNFRFDDAGGWKLGAWYYGAGLSVFGPAGDNLAAGCDWNTATGTVPTNKKAAEIDAVKNDMVAAVIVAEANNCSVAQPTDATFGGRYWNYAGTIKTDILNGKLTADTAQTWLDNFVKALCAE